METEQARRVVVMTCEEPYWPTNDTTVLGFSRVQSPDSPVSPVNRYLLAGIEITSKFVDEGLWRASPKALQRLFHRLQQEFDLYGYQFQGRASRLSEEWRNRLLFLEERSLPIRKGAHQGYLAKDRYLMHLKPGDFAMFDLAYGEEARFRYYLVKPKGAGVSAQEFDLLNSCFSSGGESISDAYFDPLTMLRFLSSCEALIWYTYSPPGRDADGPQVGICSRSSWRGLLQRLFRRGATSDFLFLDLNVLDTQGRYCLDMVRRDLVFF